MQQLAQIASAARLPRILDLLESSAS